MTMYNIYPKLGLLLIAVSAMFFSTKVYTPTAIVLVSASVSPFDLAKQKTANVLVQRYNVNRQLAIQVVDLAHKYEKPVFPKAKDILAVIAIESKFNPNAVSGLNNDPAMGLMQIRPKVWKVSATKLKDPETCIHVGSRILYRYYRALHNNKNAALQAYTVGMQNYQQGNQATNYLVKFEKVKQTF